MENNTEACCLSEEQKNDPTLIYIDELKKEINQLKWENLKLHDEVERLQFKLKGSTALFTHYI